MTTNRIEALSDGVFSIAMTLLIIEVHVPRVDPADRTALSQALVHLAPQVAAYVVSFLILGTLWIGHHNHFVHILKVNRTLLWINIGYLCAVAFLPFSTALVAAYWRQPLGGALYGINLLVAGLFLWLHWIYATSGRRLVSPDLSDEAIGTARRRIEIGFAVYLTATVVAFVWPRVSLVLFALMPIAYMISGRVDRHLEVAKAPPSR